MYKYLLALMLACHGANACDFCGCSPMVSGMDIVGLQPQSMISLVTTYKKYDFNQSGVDLETAYTMSYSLNGGYAPADWADIRINLPLQWMKNRYTAGSDNDVSEESLFGLGDMQLFANFRAWNKPGFAERKVGQQLNLGAGIELPTGRKQQTQNALLQNFNFGSQSVDYMFAGVYSLSIRQWGVTQAAWVKINTTNKEEVKFGNVYDYQVMGNYTANIRQSMLSPLAGFQVEVASRNLYNRIIQNKSGYWVLSMTYGLNWIRSNWRLGAMVYHPLAQLTSQGKIIQKTNFNIIFSYQFKKKLKDKE